MTIIKFAELWKNHPLNWSPSEAHPCRKPDGTWEPSLDNQCAIKMSIALAGAGINMSACSERKCWFKGHKNHVLVAQKLADWLSRSAQLGTPKKFIRRQTKEAVFQQTVVSAINGKQGIVFCQNFWGANNQGDHLDVWNGLAMSGNLLHDYFGRSANVWFWEIKV